MTGATPLFRAACFAAAFVAPWPARGTAFASPPVTGRPAPPRVCIVEGDAGATGARLRARAYADLELDRTVDVEGVPPDEPAAGGRAPDRPAVVMVQVITVDIHCVCSSSSDSRPCDGLCQVAELDVGCRRRSPSAFFPGRI